VPRSCRIIFCRTHAVPLSSTFIYNAENKKLDVRLTFLLLNAVSLHFGGDSFILGSSLPPPPPHFFFQAKGPSVISWYFACLFQWRTEDKFLAALKSLSQKNEDLIYIINTWTHCDIMSQSAGDCLHTRFWYQRFLFWYHEYQYQYQYHIRSHGRSRSTEMRAQFHWLAPPFWLRWLQTKASHGASLRKSTGMLYVSRFTRFRYMRRFAGTHSPRLTTVTCIGTRIIRFIGWNWRRPISVATIHH
jgi:hypothetical protein